MKNDVDIQSLMMLIKLRKSIPRGIFNCNLSCPCCHSYYMIHHDFFIKKEKKTNYVKSHGRCSSCGYVDNRIHEIDSVKHLLQLVNNEES